MTHQIILKQPRDFCRACALVDSDLSKSDFESVEPPVQQFHAATLRSPGPGYPKRVMVPCYTPPVLLKVLASNKQQGVTQHA